MLMSESTVRRPARGQSLDLVEIAILGSLTRGTQPFYDEVSSLYRAGWTLRAIGEALIPQVSRSTVRNWVEKNISSQQAPPIAPKTLEESTASTSATPTPAHRTNPVPLPVYKTDPKYIRKTPEPKPIPKVDVDTLKKLAPLARRYRSGMPYGSAEHIANDTMDLVVLRLVASGCSVASIAEAAEVSAKAIYKRLEKARRGHYTI